MSDPTAPAAGSGRYAVEPELVFERRLADSKPDETITVAVSLYNYARFLVPCLDSIHGQVHQRLELIVVDDASADDNSCEVAEGWLRSHAERFERVVLFRQRRNQGPGAARNIAFRAARSERVFVLDADNMIYPRAISRLHEALRDGGFAATYSQIEFFGAQRKIGLADLWSRDRLSRGNYIDTMALIEKAAWQKVGGYSDLYSLEDYDLWCKFVERGLVAAFVPEILCRYRVHSESLLRSIADQEVITQMTLRHPWLKIERGD